MKKENRGGARKGAGAKAHFERAILHIRLDDKTNKAIAALCKLWECTVSDAVRRAVMDAAK